VIFVTFVLYVIDRSEDGFSCGVVHVFFASEQFRSFGYQVTRTFKLSEIADRELVLRFIGVGEIVAVLDAATWPGGIRIASKQCYHIGEHHPWVFVFSRLPSCTRIHLCNIL
jgi:hypothetical protein